MTRLFSVIFVVIISGGHCQFNNGGSFPGSQNSAMPSSACQAIPFGMREVCGWEDITMQICDLLGCCWNPVDSTCFNKIDVPQINSPTPRPTMYPVAPQAPYQQAVGNAIRLPPSSNVNQQGLISTVASDLSYRGCLLHCASVNETERRTCLWDSSKDLCVSIGCCFDARMNQCFFPNSKKDPCPKTPECQITSTEVRSCGNFDEYTCNRIGCCFNSISGKPTCYRKQAIGRQGGSASVPPSTPAPQAVQSTTDVLDRLKEIQDMLDRGILPDIPPGILPPNFQLPQAAATPGPGIPPANRPPVPLPTTPAPAIQQAATPAASTTTAVPTTTKPEKTAAGVQAWTPRPLYARSCNRNGFCRNVIRSCLPRDCGDPPLKPSNFRRKIVGGSSSAPHTHPWTVMIHKIEGNRTFVCGGTIICERWVVTAAHCLDKQGENSNEADFDLEKYKLFFGRHLGITRGYFSNQVQIFQGSRDIEAMIQHENFIPGKHRGVITHDIALIKLRRPVIFNQFVHPICLPRQKAKPGEVLYATGWGISRGFGEPPDALKQLGVEIKSALNCRRRVPGFENPIGVLCGGGEPNHDTCTGDSGGPLAGTKLISTGRYSNVGKPIWYFYGLTSIGSPSCNTRQYDRQPALYTDIHYFLPWIRTNTADCCS